MNFLWVETQSAGQLLPTDSKIVGPDDRGFAYGDGVFETIRLLKGVPLFLDRHLARLRSGLIVLQFPPLRWDDEALAERCRRVMAANAASEGILRIVLTRGPGPRGFAPPTDAHPTLIVQTSPLPLIER